MKHLSDTNVSDPYGSSAGISLDFTWTCMSVHLVAAGLWKLPLSAYFVSDWVSPLKERKKNSPQPQKVLNDA